MVPHATALCLFRLRSSSVYEMIRDLFDHRISISILNTRVHSKQTLKHLHFDGPQWVAFGQKRSLGKN